MRPPISMYTHNKSKYAGHLQKQALGFPASEPHVTVAVLCDEMFVRN